MINNWDLFSRTDQTTGNTYFSLLIDGTESDARLIVKKLKGYADAPVPAMDPFVYSIPLPSNLDENTQDKIRTAVREGVEMANKVSQFVPDGDLGDPLFRNESTDNSNSFPTFIALDSLDDSNNTNTQADGTPIRASIDLDIGEQMFIKMDPDAETRVIDLDAMDETPADPEPAATPALEDKTIENMLVEEHIEVDEEKEQTSYIPATDFGSFSKTKNVVPSAPTQEEKKNTSVAPSAPTLEEKAKAATTPAVPKKSFLKKLIKKLTPPSVPDTTLTQKELPAEKSQEKSVQETPNIPLPQTVPTDSVSEEKSSAQQKLPVSSEDTSPLKAETTEDTQEMQEKDLLPVSLAETEQTETTVPQDDQPAPKEGNLEIPDFTFTQPQQPAVQSGDNLSETSAKQDSPEKESERGKNEPAQEEVPFNDHDMLIKDMEGTMLDNMPIEDIFAAETKLDMFVDVENTLKTQQDQQQREKKLAAVTEPQETGANSFDIFEQKIKEQTSIIDLNDIEAFLKKMPEPVASENHVDETENLQIEVEKVKVDEPRPEIVETTVQEPADEPKAETKEKATEEPVVVTEAAVADTPSEEMPPAKEETFENQTKEAEVEATKPAEKITEVAEKPQPKEEVAAGTEEITEPKVSEEPETAEEPVQPAGEEPQSVEQEPTEEVVQDPQPEEISETPSENAEEQVSVPPEHTFRVSSKHTGEQNDLPEIVVLRRNDIPENLSEEETTGTDDLPIDVGIKTDDVSAEPVQETVPVQTNLPETPAENTPTLAEEKPALPSVPAGTVPSPQEPSADNKETEQNFTAAQKPKIQINKISHATAAPIKPLATKTEEKSAAAPISLARKDRMEDNKQKHILKIKPKTPAAPGTPKPPMPSAQPVIHVKPTLKRPAQPSENMPGAPAGDAPSPMEKTRTIDHSIQIPLSELKKHSWPLEVPLNPTYTLSNMIMSVNRFAHATAISVIDSPGKLYNPLVFHGETGTGKTHFLNAMAYAFSQKFGQTNIFMTNGVRLSRGIQRYIMEGNIEKFEKFISTVQVLLIDDIHLLAINEQNRAYISKLLNTFLKEQKQIVITSKYPPESLEKLEELIKFKLDSGWISELKPATGPTHVKIVKKMLMDNNVDLNDSQVTDFFVSKYMTLGTVTRSIRRLKVLENLIPQTVDINQRSQAAIFEKLLASKGEDEKSRVRTTDPTTITSIIPQGNGEWGKIGFFYPANCSDKMNWMVYCLQERAKELGLEGGFEIVVRSSYATENIISSAFKIANLCDNKKLKGAVILGPQPDTCDPSVKENFYDILTHMLEIMLIRCGIINYETLRQPSTYVKLLAELMR